MFELTENKDYYVLLKNGKKYITFNKATNTKEQIIAQLKKLGMEVK